MAYAGKLRAKSCACWMLGGLTVIGIPYFWPKAWELWQAAEKRESELESGIASA